MKIAAIIPAAGQGRRLKTRRLKALIAVLGRPLLVHTLMGLRRSFRFHEMIVVAPADQIEKFKNILRRYSLNSVRVIRGGRTRAESVRNGVEKVSETCEWVLVHDAARPLVNRRLVHRLIRSAKKTGAAILAVPVTSTVKKVDVKNKMILRTEDRDTLALAQTPQVFKKDPLMRRYEILGPQALFATDEAALFDGSRTQVSVVPSDESNIKITTPQDIDLFKFYLRKK